MEASEPSLLPLPEAWWTSSFMVTFAFRCNIACTFCMVEDALGTFDGTSLAAFQAFAERARQEGGLARLEGVSRIIFSGGEVTLAKDLLGYVAAARSIPGVTHVRLQTNAIRLGDRAFLGELVRAGVDEFFVSFHAAEAELYDAIAQRKGAFTGIVRGIEAIRASGAALFTNTAIVASNYRVLPAIVEAALAFDPAGVELWNHWPRGDADGAREHVAPVGLVRGPLLDALGLAVARGVAPVVKWFPRCLLGPFARYQDDGQPRAWIEDRYWEKEPEYACLYEGVCADSVGRPPDRSGAAKCAGLSDVYVQRFGWEEELLVPRRREEAEPRVMRSPGGVPRPLAARSLAKDAGPARAANARAAAWLADRGLVVGCCKAGLTLTGFDIETGGLRLRFDADDGEVITLLARPLDGGGLEFEHAHGADANRARAGELCSALRRSASERATRRGSADV